MPRFEYTDREFCICGARLDTSNRRLQRAYAWGVVGFVQCAVCKTWCQSPRITPASLAEWYGSDAYLGSRRAPGATYSDYLADEEARLAESVHRLSSDLTPLIPRGASVMEIGCATGSLLRALRDAGYRVTGLDLSPTLVNLARSRNELEVQCGDTLSADYPTNSFDAVLLFGTISNLQGLEARLERIGEWLKPGGVLIFNFIDADSWTARLYGGRLWMFAPTVDAFMTVKGCELALQRSGFQLVRLSVDRQRPSYQKLLTHSKFTFLLPLIARLGLKQRAIPFSIPIPLAKLAVARNRPKTGKLP